MLFHTDITLADPGGGTRRTPPLTAAELWYFYAQNATFSQFFSSLASLANVAIHFKHNCNRNMPKTR